MLDIREIDELKDYRNDFDHYYTDDSKPFIKLICRFCLLVINLFEKIYESQDRR